MNTPLRIRYLLRCVALVAGFVLLHLIAAAEVPAGDRAPTATTPASTAVQFEFWAQGSLGPLRLFIVSRGDGSTSDTQAAANDVLLDVSPAAELATLSAWLIGLGVLALAMWRQQGRAAEQTCGEDTAIMD